MPFQEAKPENPGLMLNPPSENKKEACEYYFNCILYIGGDGACRFETTVKYNF
jgi:hypothetical protein